MRYLRRIAGSFPYAFAGVVYLIRTQTNFWVHLGAAAVVIVLIVLLDVRGVELAVLALAVGLVLVAEGFNTAVESAVDLASPERQPLARVAKDVGAGAVLIAAATAVVVGLVVFLPRLLALLGR